MHFSIIIPTYNRLRLLDKTIASIPLQDPRITEVIVIDDGSSDGTVEYLSTNYSEVRIISQDNCGPGAARNRGIDAATGEWIAFLDSDDLWLPWTLDYYENAISATDARIVFGKPLPFLDHCDVENLTATSTDDTRWEVFDDYYASGDEWRWWGASSLVVQKDSIGDYRFTEASINGEDADFVMKLGHGIKLAQIKGNPTFGYRQHTGSLMGNLNKTVAGAWNLANSENAAAYPGGNDRKRERRRILGRHLRPVILELFNTDRRQEAWNLFCETKGWHILDRRWRFIAAVIFAKLGAR